MTLMQTNLYKIIPPIREGIKNEKRTKLNKNAILAQLFKYRKKY